MFKYIIMVAEIEKSSRPMHERPKYERTHDFSNFEYLGTIELQNHCYTKELSRALETERKLRLGFKVQHKKKFVDSFIVPNDMCSLLFGFGELVDVTQRTLWNDKYKFILKAKF